MQHYQLIADIDAAWSGLPIPDADELIAEYEDNAIARSENEEIRRWLLGRDYRGFVAFENYIEAEMPFYYITSKSVCYYIAGYMLDLLERLDRSEVGTCSFSDIHLLRYISKDRFIKDIALLPRRYRELVLTFMEVVKREGKQRVGGMDDDCAEGFDHNLAALTAQCQESEADN